jgi:hypothetical protein
MSKNPPIDRREEIWAALDAAFPGWAWEMAPEERRVTGSCGELRCSVREEADAPLVVARFEGLGVSHLLSGPTLADVLAQMKSVLLVEAADAESKAKNLRLALDPHPPSYKRPFRSLAKAEVWVRVWVAELEAHVEAQDRKIVALREAISPTLIAAIRGLSEDLWCAQWMRGIEYTLWAMVVDEQPIRHPTNPSVDPDEWLVRDIESLRRLVELTGCWAWLDPQTNRIETVPLARWRQIYAERDSAPKE